MYILCKTFGANFRWRKNGRCWDVRCLSVTLTAVVWFYVTISQTLKRDGGCGVPCQTLFSR